MNAIFFYGLFMDEIMLKNKGFHPTKPVLAYVDGYGLRIGERATLVESSGERAYGSIMSLNHEELQILYGDASVADYIPENLIATTLKNEVIEVISYNLPLKKLVGQNKKYVRSLVAVGQKVGLPLEYIKRLGELGKS